MHERIPQELPLNRSMIKNRLDAYDIPYTDESFEDSSTDGQVIGYLTEILDLDSYGIGLEDLLA